MLSATGSHWLTLTVEEGCKSLGRRSEFGMGGDGDKTRNDAFGCVG